MNTKSLDEMLRDRLVCGVNDERIQRRLLAEDKLTFTKALQLAQAMEGADRDTKDLNVSQDHQQIRPQRKVINTARKGTSSVQGSGKHLVLYRFQVCKLWKNWSFVSFQESYS